MAPLRNDRYQSAIELRQALGAGVKVETTGLRSWRWPAIGIVLAALLLGAFICGGVLWLALMQSSLQPVGLAQVVA